MGRMSGKVAFITGIARGQGRSHAVRLAEEGANIIGVDICGQIGTVPFPMSTPQDLEETVRLVEQTGQRIHAVQADVRDLGALQAAVADGVAAFGRLDTVVANAGTVNTPGWGWELDEEAFDDQIAVCLTGVWKTLKATVPTLIEQGEGGSIILISSTAGLTAELQLAHYTAAKHGVTGLARTFSVELAPYMIRVNSIHPTNVRTPMIDNDYMASLFTGGREGSKFEDPDVQRALQDLNSMPLPYIEPVDVSNAVLYLASDESRGVTSQIHTVDLGFTSTPKIPHNYS